MAGNHVDALRRMVRGSVVGPGDAGYDEARAVFHGGIDRRPAAVVEAAGEEDVATVVRFASETGLELAVRGGGHSPAGHGTSEGGLVLDLGRLDGFRMDPDGRTAWAGAGLTAAAYTAAAGAHGLATGFGDTGSVGISGITLAGGIGFLVRKHGLTVDSLLAAEVVTAEGERLVVDEDHHPDLFWALRGGGGNFGVVTRLRYRLHELPGVVGGILVLPATPEVVASFVELAQEAPEELSTIANVMPAPPLPGLPEELVGRPSVFALLCFAGEEGSGERAVAPFRALAPPLLDAVRPIAYREMYPPDDASYRPTAVARTGFADEVGGSAAELILEALAASDAPLRAVQLRALGGAMARVPADATAFAHRGRRLMVNVAAFYEGPRDLPARRAWVEELSAALTQGPGAYVGFLAEDGEGRIREAYPDGTWGRLRAVKARYDPGNLFRVNHNIPPGGGRAADGRARAPRRRAPGIGGAG
ncbi:MAG TPA: FAD-binding oxidoreductase [Actinomycetota bacterium]|nr:FAD-binding oxidoreductase [Actinomycetota bacterium]